MKYWIWYGIMGIGAGTVSALIMVGLVSLMAGIGNGG